MARRAAPGPRGPRPRRSKARWLGISVAIGVLAGAGWTAWRRWAGSTSLKVPVFSTPGLPAAAGPSGPSISPTQPTTKPAPIVETPKQADLPPVEKEPAPKVATDTDQVRAEIADARTPAARIRPPPELLLSLQLALTGHGISVGPIDGVGGAQTASALRAFQMQHGLEQTGRPDPATVRELETGRGGPFTLVTITAADLAGLAPVPKTWLGRSRARTLGFETLLELVAERHHAQPSLVRRLNPAVDWDHPAAGLELWVPRAAYPPARRAALVRVSLGQRWIRAFDAQGNLLAHFPCSIGRIAEKRPVGELHVAVAVKDPDYTFDPAVFPESAEAKEIGRKLRIPPGPNNPVGIAWIGLDKPGFGIHGTPAPEQVGRTESHGCFRLANWNATYLRQMVTVGTPVWIEP